MEFVRGLYNIVWDSGTLVLSTHAVAYLRRIKMLNETIDNVWKAVWGSPRRPDWIHNVWTPTQDAVFVEGVSWYNQPQPFFIEDIEGKTSDLINPDDLVKLLREARADGWTHCGRYPLMAEDPDACLGDLVLQRALFGEIVYG